MLCDYVCFAYFQVRSLCSAADPVDVKLNSVFFAMVSMFHRTPKTCSETVFLVYSKPSGFEGVPRNVEDI